MTPSRRHALKTIAGVAALQSGLPSRASAAARLPLKLAILDVGGTIVEERGDVPEALGSAFSKQGLTVTPAEINDWRGASKREIVRHFVDLRTKLADHEKTRLVETIYAEFSTSIISSYKTVKPIAGAEEAFRALRERGLLLATSTGFDRPITVSIMKRLGWEQYFVAMITSDDVRHGRPSPYMLFHAMEAAHVDSVDQVIAVGDTPLDLQAGTNAGFRGVIGVLSGVGNVKTMTPEPHTELIESVAGLPALLAAKYY
jgi:phosphonatase-like hydrolase